jgi:NTE family protein
MASPRTALVLSGGGVRGAYEVGALSAILEILAVPPEASPPFQIFAGTSVGAMNAAFLAAHADRGDLAIEELRAVWESIEISEVLQVDPFGLIDCPRLLRRRQQPQTVGTSLLDPAPLRRIVRDTVPWDRLHANVQGSLVDALFVAALDVADGRTNVFAEVAPDVEVQPSRFPERPTVFEPIGPDHVLASAALPILYPAQLIGERYFLDGGLRFNTPIAPALRAGADRVVVISLLSPEAPVDPLADYPDLGFLLGKVLNALILDPVVWDLENLLRINRIFEVLEDTLPPEMLARVERALAAERGLPYRRIPTLHLEPSEDIGLMAAEFVRNDLDETGVGLLTRALIRVFTRSDVGQEAELAAFFLLDGAFAARLVDLGRRDALARADEILAFFA